MLYLLWLFLLLFYVLNLFECNLPRVKILYFSKNKIKKLKKRLTLNFTLLKKIVTNMTTNNVCKTSNDSNNITDFCRRFSHFHPDRYKNSEIPVFSNSIGQIIERNKTTSNESSVYDVSPNKPERSEQVWKCHVFTGLVLYGMIYI